MEKHHMATLTTLSLHQKVHLWVVRARRNGSGSSLVPSQLKLNIQHGGHLINKVLPGITSFKKKERSIIRL